MSFRNVYRATDYSQHAGQFIAAYYKLADVDAQAGLAGVEKDMQLPSVKLLLLGHGFELVLKGWLVLLEDTPQSLSQEEKNALMAAGKDVPVTLKKYGHDLEKLGAAAVKYYPALQQPLENGLIAHLNRSYYGDGNRDYEYPEIPHKHENPNTPYFSSFFTPLDTLAAMIKQTKQALHAAIEADPWSMPHTL